MTNIKNFFNKTLREGDELIEKIFRNNKPCFKVRSSDGKDFPLLLYSVCGYPNNWNDLIITDVVEEWVNSDNNTKVLVLIAVINKIYDEISRGYNE